MYISFQTKRKLRTVGITLGIIAILGGIAFGLSKVIKFQPGASPQEAPQNIRITDLSTSKAIISWTTEASVSGYVIYGPTTDLDQFVRDKRDVIAGSLNEYTVHYVVLDNLDPDTAYLYKIVSGTEEYGNSDDSALSFSTLPADLDIGLSAPRPFYGTVTNDPGAASVVYVQLRDNAGNNSAVVTSLTNEAGGWEVDLANLLTEDNTQKFVFDDETAVTISAQGGALGTGRKVSTIGADVASLDISLTTDSRLADQTEEPDTDDADDSTDDTNDTPADQTGDDTGDPTDDTNDDPVNPPPGDNQGSVPPTNTGTTSTWTILKQDVALSTQATTSTGITITGEPSVRITNVTDTRFTVTWITPVKVKGTVSYGSSSTSLNSTAYDERDTIAAQGLYYVHHVNVTDLDIGETYYIKVNSGTDTYYAASPKAVTLNELSSAPPTLNLLNGSVSGLGRNDVLLFATITDGDNQGSGSSSQEISTVPNASGGFSLSLGEAYNSTGSGYFQSTAGDSVAVNLKTYGDSDTETVLISAVDSGIAFTLDSYGSTDGRANNLYDMSILTGNSPKTAGLTTVLLSLGALIVGGLLSGQLYMYNRKHAWENNITRELDSEA